MTTLKKLICGVVALTVLSVAVFGISASALSNATARPAFNWYDNVSGVGDESDFLRIGANAAEGVNTKEVCQEGARLKFWFYIHNGSEPINNGANLDGPGVAVNTRLNLSVPQNQAGNSHDITASISANNADTVADKVTITCATRKVTLEYVGVTDFATTATNNALGAFTLGGDPINGASLGYPGGKVPGCWEFRGRLNFEVIVHVQESPKADPKPNPVPPELPKTGTGSALAIFSGTTLLATLAHRYGFSRKNN